ncbi:MAG: hypothetical protein RL544_1870 [Bacteroidota bacterium]|jgi:hypothetical protein
MKKILLLSSLLLGVFISIQAQDSTLTQFTGKFKFAEGSPVQEVVINADNGALVAVSAMGSFVLQKTGEDQFFIAEFQAPVVYKRDSNKKVVGLAINANGMILEAVKVEAASFVDEKMVYFTR